MPTEQELKSYYGALTSEDWWQYEEEREVWRHVRAEIERAPVRTVLDVGCFRGDLLAYLGDAWDRFGVEPSLDARRVAESRGVRIIGETVESLADSTMRFGAITLIDVIEHLPRPLDSLRKLTRLLLPGGRLVIFTGATDALSWRFAGEHYWYSAMPEHVVFFRPSWFRWAAPQLGCSVESVRRLPFHPAPLRERADEALKNIAYVGFKRLAQFPLVGAALRRMPVVGRIDGWTGSWWTSARDHALVTLVRQGDDE
jgi:SAM-dependent methyltransferase